jgi:uncharacterized protein YigE (DUF2233 family)
MSRRWRAVLACVLGFACSKTHKAPPLPAPPSAAVSRAAASAAPSASAAAPAAGLVLHLERQIGKSGDALSAELYRYTGAASHGRMWVAHVRPGKAHIQLLPVPRPRPLADILKGREPRGDYVAVNGGFYDQERPMGLVVAGGSPVAPLRERGGSGVFFVEMGRPAIVHRDAYKAKKPALALQSVDRLVDGGRVLVRARPGLRRDARSAVVIDAEGAVLFAVAFDAQAAFPLSDDEIRMSAASTTSGPTLLEFAKLLVGDLHARTALNLDGGSSTSMRIRIGKAHLDVIARHATINVLVADRR